MKICGILLLSSAASACLAATDWTRFRGPNGSGVADTKDLPVEFGPATNVVWKAALPTAYSSPVLAGEHVFVTATEVAKLRTAVAVT